MASNNLTTDDIRTMEVAEARKFVTGARTAVKNAVKADRNATNRAAYATWQAEHILGWIGQANKGNDAYLTDEAWAASFEKVKSITGAWRTLGRVLVDLRLDPEGETYMRLRNSNIYQTTDGKKVIKDATAETVEADLIKFMEGKVDKFGKRITQRAASTSNDTEEEKARKERLAAAELDGKIGEFVAEVGKDADITAQALVLVAALAKTVAPMDHDEWEPVRVALAELVEERMDAFKKALQPTRKSA